MYTVCIITIIMGVGTFTQCSTSKFVTDIRFLIDYRDCMVDHMAFLDTSVME